jgi:hypothetical protein
MISAMTLVGESGADLVAAMTDIVTEEAGPSEQARTLTAPIIGAMWDTGLMTYMNPAPAGGSEPSFAEMIDIWQRMAWLDGSFGWIGIANLPSSAAVAAFLPDEGFDEVFGSGEPVTMLLELRFGHRPLGLRLRRLPADRRRQLRLRRQRRHQPDGRRAAA